MEMNFDLGNRDDLRTILPFLPLKLEKDSLAWPIKVIEPLTALSKGPGHSQVDSGDALFHAIEGLRATLSVSSTELSSAVAPGYRQFFDEVLTRDEAEKWFAEVVPAMADLLIRLPSLLTSHYKEASLILDGVETGLRLLEPQCPGIVILSQELIAALLSCSFFCLFPSKKRTGKKLQKINSDMIFGFLYQRQQEHLKHKIKCITHYFERVCSCMPKGFVSFERKVVLLEQNSSSPNCLTASFWAKSTHPLCKFEVFKSPKNKIEDHRGRALEVDFADPKLGGLILRQGCVQEEIRFAINPELIAGMFFMSFMADNEAIEIIGAERFSNYSGYNKSFRFYADCVDKTEVDSIGRHKTRVVAIDALRKPGLKQFTVDLILREVVKAYCGFQDQSNYKRFRRPTKVGTLPDLLTMKEHSSKDREEGRSIWDEYKQVGVATGNWGCGVFGGDPELKSMLQWLAASQASRPFLSYYTFGMAKINDIDKVVQRIESRKWKVGDLWSKVLEYSSKRAKRGSKVGGFFSYLLATVSLVKESRENAGNLPMGKRLKIGDA